MMYQFLVVFFFSPAKGSNLQDNREFVRTLNAPTVRMNDNPAPYLTYENYVTFELKPSDDEPLDLSIHSNNLLHTGNPTNTITDTRSLLDLQSSNDAESNRSDETKRKNVQSTEREYKQQNTSKKSKSSQVPTTIQGHLYRQSPMNCKNSEATLETNRSDNNIDCLFSSDQIMKNIDHFDNSRDLVDITFSNEDTNGLRSPTTSTTQYEKSYGQTFQSIIATQNHIDTNKVQNNALNPADAIYKTSIGANILDFNKFATGIKHGRIAYNAWDRKALSDYQEIPNESSALLFSNVQDIITGLSSLRYTARKDEIKHKILACLGSNKVNLREYESQCPPHSSAVRGKEVDQSMEGKSELLRIVKENYKQHLGEIQTCETEHSQIRAFMRYVADSVLCEHGVYEFYVLKPALWKLQLFMPELYFYIVWRLKKLDEFLVANSDTEKNILSEMEILHQLLIAFCGIEESITPFNNGIELLENAIHNYRTFIWTLLGQYHQNEMCNIFYSYALRISNRNYSTQKNEEAMDLFFILAFTSSSPVFSELAQELTKKKQRTGECIGFRDFTYYKILNCDKYKKQTTSTIMFVVELLSLLKNDKQVLRCHMPVIFEFKNLTIVISKSVSDDYLLVAEFLSQKQLLCYIFEQYQRVMKQ